MWHQRLLPYPILSKTTGDYPLSGFTCRVQKSVLSNGTEINLELEYRLNCDSLQLLVASRQADYAVQTACVRTYNRELHTAGQQNIQYLTLPAGDYAHEIIATPYIVATESIHGFTSKEHAAEIAELKPDGFDLTRGSILAVADSIRIIVSETNSDSVMDLAADVAVPRGHYDIDLTNDRINLYVNPADKLLLERLRSQRAGGFGRAALSTAFYLNAITQALHRMHEYPESKWAQSIRIALERHKLDADHETIRRNAPKYAQVILEAPFGQLLIGLTNTPDEGQQEHGY